MIMKGRSNMKPEFLPIILGADENAYGCARMFYDGFNVKPILLCSMALAPTDFSRILTRREIKDFDSFPVFSAVMTEILTVLSHEHSRIVVVSCSDYYSEMLIRLEPKISHLVANDILDSDIYERIKDKASFYKLCLEYGLPHPKTVIMSPSTLISADTPLEYPVVLKPANSNCSAYLKLDFEGKRKVYLCKNADEIADICSKMVCGGYTEDCVIQKYIEGGENRMRVINAYCDRKGKVRLIGAAKPLLCFHDGSSIGNYAVLATVKERELCDQAADFLEKLGYVGFANFDLKYDPESGEYVFFELNPRPGRSSYYMNTAGKNLMEAMVRDSVRGEPFTEREYADKEGVFTAVPISFVEKFTDNPTNIFASIARKADCALRFDYDFSPRRAYSLTKRNITLLRRFDGNRVRSKL
ncbi:MAG: hypothetical protein E7634_01665 [Ruminococcaceae bacterium]|nr:hypothetical protein [Oscillospiraceae bacterium]